MGRRVRRVAEARRRLGHRRVRPPARPESARILTTTPKRRAKLRELLARSDTVVSLATTSDNPHLPVSAGRSCTPDYGGTTLGRQELDAEIIEDVEGRSGRATLIVYDEPRRHLPEGRRDARLPARRRGDRPRRHVECEVERRDGHDRRRSRLRHRGYVLDDLSAGCIAGRLGSARVAAYRDYRADRLVAEANNGGDLVATVIRAIDPIGTRDARPCIGLPWHLEDENDDEVADESSPEAKAIQALMERPQAALVGRKQMTRRELWSLTSRHVGLCGMAYWYLDQLDALGRTPTAILYVNPARVWPQSDRYGNLIGWKLDCTDDAGNGGMPLELDELLPFYLDPPDWGHYGTGFVEAAWQKAQITGLADSHASHVLASGGRIAGIVSPKDGYITDSDQFAQLVKDFREVNERPDAAKRTTILRGPVDFASTAADPSELSLIDLSKMNRDDIFGIWSVPPSQGGIGGQTVGLNSGETRHYEWQTLMQGPVHDRVVSMVETIQYGLLDDGRVRQGRAAA
jgi:phage portal protein BeeE